MLHHLIEPLPNFPFGHYLVLKSSLIGRGLNCLVYEGANIITGERVCIKKIDLVNQIQQQLTLNQVQCLKRVEHPNVLRYLHHFQISNSTYIVTELCSGNLFDKLRKCRKMRQGQALEIFLQLLSGYEEIRKKGFLHRDLKPQNIFFKEGKLKLGDFGFCIELKQPQIRERHNVGSPLYMAPQAIERNIYSEKSDVWSLGLILYEMLHGKNPFKSRQEKDLIVQMKNSTIKYDCHPTLEKILKGALNYNREQRLTLKELQCSLIQFLSQDSTLQKCLNSVSLEKKIANEFRYVRFMEYIKILSSKCRKNDKSARINFLFEFAIRSRLKLLESQEFCEAIKTKSLSQQLDLLKMRHNQQLSPPPQLNQNDRLRFFNPDVPNFDYFALWQIQAELKDTLKQMFRSLVSIDTQEKVAKFENQLKLVDFLLTAYVLNRLLIESENNMQEFSGRSQLSIILTGPHRFNLGIWQIIQQKGEDLRII